jgi:hypothetical protein
VLEVFVVPVRASLGRDDIEFDVLIADPNFLLSRLKQPLRQEFPQPREVIELEGHRERPNIFHPLTAAQPR